MKAKTLPPWSVAEDMVIADLYPEGGWKAVVEALPMRSRHGICKRAASLGIKYAHAFQESNEEPTGWPVPEAPILTEQLLNLHNRRAYGAMPGQLSWRV